MPEADWSNLINELSLWPFMITGAIIGDRDRKRAPFLVLGLFPWYGTIFLFLEQIASSPATLRRAYMLQGVWRMSRRKNGVRDSRNRSCFLAQHSTPLWLLEFCLSIFVVSCSTLSEDSAEFRYVPLYIADQVEFPEFRCSFYKNFTLLHSKCTCEDSQLFHDTHKLN